MPQSLWIVTLIVGLLGGVWFMVPLDRQEASAAASNREPLSLVILPVEEQSLLPLIADVFETAAAGDVDAAVEQFSRRAYRENQRAFDQLRTILTNLNQVAGGYDGTELVAVRRVSPRFTEVWTVSWFEPGPYLFKVRFYQKDGQWCFADFAGTNEMNDFIDKVPLTFVTRYEEP